MNRPLFTFVFIPILVLTFMTIARYIRKKLARPDVNDKVQTPGKFDRFIKIFITIITVFTTFMAIMGAIAQEFEMAIVFLVMTLFFIGAILILNREYDMSYEENSEYFILTKKKKEVKVFYEDIVDWLPSPNEIWVLDQSKKGNKYIKVNISIFKPEILLQKITEMTFNGEFEDLNDTQMEQELINHLSRHHYHYLVEDYIA